MNNSIKIGAIVAAAALSLASVGAQASQKSKNDWRNIGTGAAAVAGYGLLHHNNTATILGAAGAAYSANRYEQDRKHQSQANSRRYHRSSNQYYWYQGHQYYQAPNGSRHFVR